MNELLNNLADTLDISNKGLEKVIETVGGVNYADVYQMLLREYTIYSISRSLQLIGAILTFIGGLVLIMTEGFDDLEKYQKPLKCSFLVGIVLLIVSIFMIIFYPNINLILGLIGDE